MTRDEEIREAAEIYSAYVDATDEEDLYNSTELEAFEDGAKWADRHPAKKQAVTIEAWVARDKNMDLFLYLDKPHKIRNEWVPNKINGTFLEFDCTSFQEVTFENSPKKVKVTIEMEEEK